MKKMKIILCILLAGAMLFGAGAMLFGLTACEDDNTVTMSSKENKDNTEAKVTYEVELYDNQGNNYISFQGHEFTISPNKVKQYGYNTDGSWTHWWETSSVVTINVDGNYIETCGSTAIFKDTRLDMLHIPESLETKPSEGDEYSVAVDNRTGVSYIGLTNWWYDMKEKGQNGEKIILIQSQDGYNIGAFVGKDVEWRVEEKLPKTTRLMIDGYPVYIHRCNFTVIDTKLMSTEFQSGNQ